MSNSGIRNIGIITKYNYQSLMDHLANCEDWDLHLGENVRFCRRTQRDTRGAYRGKLEALQTALPVLERSDAEYVILSDTTVLCAIDFAEVVDAHVASGCDLTVVAKAGRADGRRTQTLALKVDDSGKVVDLAVDYCAAEGLSFRYEHVCHRAQEASEHHPGACAARKVLFRAGFRAAAVQRGKALRERLFVPEYCAL